MAAPASAAFIKSLYKSRTATTIGSGAFGTVKKVTFGGKEYAIKQIHLTSDPDYNDDDKTFIDDFKKEVEIMKHLRDRGLCPRILPCIYDAYIDDNVGYVMMDLLTDGDTMDDYIRALYTPINTNVNMNMNTSESSDSAPLPPLTFVAENLRKALDEIHAADIIHLDIKPDNIWVRRDGSVQFLDFGLACKKPCRGKYYVGTPGYQRAKRRNADGKYIRNEKDNYHALAETLYGSFDPTLASHPVKPIADELSVAARGGSRKFLKVTRRRKRRVNIRRRRTLRRRGV
jgi:tRNA A-37 threonylcarbamoyl transferase component Bud32